MAVHRGSTIYIPIIVPENWQLCGSLICGLIGLVCLLFALLTSNWNETIIKLPETATSYAMTATLKWGLRSIHIQWCTERTAPGSSSGASNGATVISSSCASEDIQYSKCGQGDAYWCSSAVDPIFTFYLIIFSCVGLVVSTFIALSRRIFQPVGYSLCVIACSVAIMVFRTCQIMFEPSGQLLDWIQNGYTDTSQGVSYYVMTAGTFVLLFGMLLATWGTFRISRRGHVTEPQSVEGDGNPNASSSTVAPPVAAVSAAPSGAALQLQNNERVLSVIASAPNRVPTGATGGNAEGASSLNSKGANNNAPSQLAAVGESPQQQAPAASTTPPSSGIYGVGPTARRAAIDNEGMDFETLNEPSAVVMTEMPATITNRPPDQQQNAEDAL